MTFETSGEAYDRLIGRYLPELAVAFADAAGVRAGQRALDVGCGPGGLTRELVARLDAANVNAIDPSESFVAVCRERNPGVDVRRGVAEELPFADGAFDAALASLVVHFMTDPVKGIREMARVAGTVAACVWDLTGGMQMLSIFWAAASALDPQAPNEIGLAGTGPGELGRIFREAGLGRVEEGTLDVGAQYAGFDDWWEPFALGIGPVGAYYAALDDERRTALREECRERLGDPQGPFRAPARAWLAVGTA